MPSPVRIAVAAVLIAGAASALALSAQTARAQWLALPDTVEAMRAASRVAPANADYRARIAILDSSDTEGT